MKKTIISIILVLSASIMFAHSIIGVVDFDSGSWCTQEEAAVMTDAFRNELVRSGKTDVIDRAHMDELKDEMRFSMSDWTDPVKVKQVGNMLSADYLVFGRFGLMGKKGYLQVEMTDVETRRIIHSERVILSSWDEFDKKVGVLAKNFISRIPEPDFLAGTWTATTEEHGSLYTYTITFISKTQCEVAIAGILDGNAFSQKTIAGFVYADNILNLTVAFTNPVSDAHRYIQWTSVVSLSDDHQSFNILAKPASIDKDVRLKFIKKTE